MFQIRGLGEDWSTMTFDEAPAGEDREAAATYCGKKYGITHPSFTPCVNFYAGPHEGEFVPPTSPSTIVKTLPKISQAFLTTVNAGLPSVTRTPPTAISAITQTLIPAGVPWYKTPLGIGAILLGAFAGFRYLKK